MKKNSKKNNNTGNKPIAIVIKVVAIAIFLFVVLSMILLSFNDSQNYSKYAGTETKNTKSSLDDKKGEYYEDKNYNNKSAPEKLNDFNQTIHKTFYIHSMSPEENVYKLQVDIPYNLYMNYSKTDESKRILAKMTTPNDPIIEDISKKLIDLYQSDNNYFYLNSIFELASNIKYTSDYSKDEDGEYWKFPVETLVDGEGDCEDTTFLLASIFEAVNWDTILLEFPGHIGIAIELPDAVMKNIVNAYRVPVDYYVYENKKYYYIETTNTKQFYLSEIPPELKKSNYQIHPVIDKKENHNSGFEEIISNYENNSNWKEYVYLNDKFKVLFPSVPIYETRY